MVVAPGLHSSVTGLQFGESRTLAQRGEQKTNICGIIEAMAGARCRVSFTDSGGVLHGIDVDADGLYEAVALAVAQFREDELNPSDPSPLTEFTISVYRNPVEHKVRFNQVIKWAEHTTKDGPASVTKRNRVRSLLGVGT